MLVGVLRLAKSKFPDVANLDPLALAEVALEYKALDPACRRKFRQQYGTGASARKKKKKNCVKAIEKTVERQTVLHHWGIDQDVFGLYREGGFIEAIVLMVRGGKLTSTHRWSFQDLEFADEDVLADLLTQYYSRRAHHPRRGDRAGRAGRCRGARRAAHREARQESRVSVPQRGDKLRLLEMAMENARQSFASRRDNESTREKMLDELRTKLHLRNTPKRIECYDISNLQGSMVVGSQATFDEGEPRKDLYRRYRIRSCRGSGRFRQHVRGAEPPPQARAVEENEYPGSVGHRRRQGPTQCRARGAARNSTCSTRSMWSRWPSSTCSMTAASATVIKSEERVFLPNRKDPIVLPKNSTALFLLVRIRDEAHRFAITYNRELRRRARLRSVLDDIEGIGPVRRRALLRHFGSLRRIREATADESRR